MLLESKVSISRIFFSVPPSKNFPYLQRWLLLGSCGFMSGINSFSGGMYVDISVDFPLTFAHTASQFTTVKLTH